MAFLFVFISPPKWQLGSLHTSDFDKVIWNQWHSNYGGLIWILKNYSKFWDNYPECKFLKSVKNERNYVIAWLRSPPSCVTSFDSFNKSKLWNFVKIHDMAGDWDRNPRWNFNTFKELRNWFDGIESASLWLGGPLRQPYSFSVPSHHRLFLKVHKIENFFGSDFEFCVISLLVMLKY